MARALKVFVVAVGFHDAYVAAPSRKAALTAWGSEHDLFARGLAHEVTDPALTAEPLADPGKVVKRSRGTAAEQIAALPPDVPRAPRNEATDDTPRAKAKPKPVVAPARREPKPSRDTLAAAERAAAEAERRHRAEDKALADRQTALDRERRDTERTHAEESGSLADDVERERNRYDRALKRWRG